jgi:hypothetical protein
MASSIAPMRGRETDLPQSPVPASFDVPLELNPTGKLTGYVTFRVYLCEPDEELPPGRPAGRPLAEHRARAGGPGRPIVIHRSPSSPLAGVTPARFMVPESVLAGLPDDALLRFTWGFGDEHPSSTKDVRALTKQVMSEHAHTLERLKDR